MAYSQGNIADTGNVEDLESDHGQHEGTPLLPTDLPPAIAPDKAFKRRVFAMMILFIAVVDIAATIMEAPTQEIIEDFICRQHFPSYEAQEEPQNDGCKGAAVQKTLAMVRAYQFACQSFVRESLIALCVWHMF